MMERLTYSEFTKKVLDPSQMGIVDFYSDSCVACKKMVPILTALEKQYSCEVSFWKVNVAYEKELAEQYQVMTVPVLLIFKDGKEIKRLVGVRKKGELEQVIEENKG